VECFVAGAQKIVIAAGVDCPRARTPPDRTFEARKALVPKATSLRRNRS
jgi:hypothetical protein